ncbi:zinc carboxypeptidase [Parashewanella spongiae]|uniref:Zinc carboxypeptidase n=1 Tax=Parashewanella spongiae TaxID=342950 RepID=A0A3A6U328_9GAMM|nr:M14 family metallopeptidase [Parashewanella spongiae]MCL1079499.1 M14 family metallopeptidase [Parashewanella spongiae]RJY07540.1 zinc carboxypeptidase [Parashewanella spongiae]
MKKTFLLCLFIICANFHSYADNPIAPSESNHQQACDTGSVRLLADFEASRMDECKNLGDNRFHIIIKPENTPINPSPWYAFKVIADQATDVNVTIKIADKRKNRYLPKISQDMQTWSPQAHRVRGKRLTFTIKATEQPQYVAAQEVINNQYYVDWANKLQAVSQVSHSRLGESAQKRPIYKIESKANTNEWLVILGRLHPPEITGALALFPFVETLLAKNKLADHFRQKFNILIIPNLNPDGVAMGNWRHNAHGADLNRDWVSFKQPETIQVHQYLQGLVAQGQKIKFAIDFHSTNQDVFYTMPTNYDVEDRYFVKHWLNSLDQAMPNFNVIQKPGNRPNNGVSKQYFADNYQIHAITYEMGDETKRDNIIAIANNAAITLMQTMMSDANHNKE